MNYSKTNQDQITEDRTFVNNTLKALSFEEASENSREIFNGIKSKIGMVPNLYASMGVSDKLLGGFLAFQETFFLCPQ